MALKREGRRRLLSHDPPRASETIAATRARGGMFPVDPAYDALVVVDVQNDFCPGGSLAVPDGDRVVPVLNRYIQRFLDDL